MRRREFLLLGAAAPLLKAERHLDIGIGTYSYHSLSLEAMTAQLRKLNVKQIEMSRGEFMLLSHPQDDLFRRARALFDRAGIRCVSYYAATIHDEGELDAALRFAGILGSRNITADATGAELLKLIDRKCTAAGLTLGIHNHYFKTKFAYESPEDILRALEGLSPTVGATADVGHFASCGHDPVDAVRKLAARLKLVHLKDIRAAGGEENVLLGQGIAKIWQVMAELRRQNFGGLVAVEYEKEGPVEDDLATEIAFARKLA